MTPPKEATTAPPTGSRHEAIGPMNGRADSPALPAGARIDRLELRSGETLDLLVMQASGEVDAAPADAAHLAGIASGWVARGDARPAALSLASRASSSSLTPPVVIVPLYGCHVAWTPGRAAVVGPAAAIDQLRTVVAGFADGEAELRDAEMRLAAVLDHLEGDAAVAFASDPRPLARRTAIADRYREAVAVRRNLARSAPAIHAAPIHPPTLASQLGERLRDRARLAERHELAVDRADFAERVSEACGQRAADLAIARRQLGLEWAIVVLLVAQTAMLLVEMLGSRGTP